MFGFRDCFIKCFIFFSVSCIKSIIACHFKIPFRYVLHQKFDKIHRRYGFAYKDIIFMAIVVECYAFTVIRIYASECNHRTPKISANILENSLRITKIWFGINIKTIFIFFVNKSFCFLEGRTNALFHFIQESRLKGL